MRKKRISSKDDHIVWIEKALERFLPSVKVHPPQVYEAMRYAVLDGGKRFRPLVVLSACEAVGGDPRRALLPACAIEFIHAYSLVHDDLPALDNDEMRRGRPTCHRKFGEAMAILAGDGLLTEAFQLLSQVRPAPKALLLIHELAEAAGTRGMIGGQVADILLGMSLRAPKGAPACRQAGSNLNFEIASSARGSAALEDVSPPRNDKAVNLSTLDFINRQKTGRLIQASAVMGAIVGTSAKTKIEIMRRFGAALGLAFQVVDDIMDGDGYLRLINFEEARRKTESLIKKAKREARLFGNRGKQLLGLADFLLERIPTPNQNQNDVPVASEN